MRKYRQWRKGVYERSLTAIRLLDLNYLPRVEHPHRPGELAYDIELPLRDRNGEETFCSHASTIEELETVILHWFAALTRPARMSGTDEYSRYYTEGEVGERVRVADHYAKKIFHDDLPQEQRYALLAAIMRCNWFDIHPSRLRSYFRGVMRRAAKTAHRATPMILGGTPVQSIEAPIAPGSSASLQDTLSELGPETEETESDILLRDLGQFSDGIPRSQPKLRRMAAILLDTMDEKMAIERYGRGGTSQLKHLKREVRAWLRARDAMSG